MRPYLSLCDIGMELIFVAYRINTFPLIHLNVLHALLNVVALTPLMERFENEYGTLTTLALFFGREFFFPLIIVIRKLMNTSICDRSRYSLFNNRERYSEGKQRYYGSQV